MIALIRVSAALVTSAIQSEAGLFIGLSISIEFKILEPNSDQCHEALYAEEPLSDLDCRKFVAVDIIGMCHSLVVHEESDGIVRFIHFTVQEFLKSLTLPVIYLAKTCVTYLQCDAFNNICSDEKSMGLRLQTNRFCL